jgi:hypothetical protein
MTWRIERIEQLPTGTLDAWMVLEVPSDGLEQPWTRHLVGLNLEGCKAQVSSPVEAFDPISRRALTRSGRVYELGERPGPSADAFSLWGVWKQTFGIEEEREVTEEVEALVLGWAQ